MNGRTESQRTVQRHWLEPSQPHYQKHDDLLFAGPGSLRRIWTRLV